MTTDAHVYESNPQRGPRTPGRANRINVARSPLNLAGTRRRPIPQPVDAATLAGQVLGRIALEARVASMTAAKHQAVGCPSPGDCRPCEGERRRQLAEDRAEYERRDELARRQATRQHHESARKLAELAARRRRPRRELTNTTWWPSCAKCSTTLQDGTTCRSCGTETIHPRLDAFLNTLNGRNR